MIRSVLYLPGIGPSGKHLRRRRRLQLQRVATVPHGLVIQLQLEMSHGTTGVQLRVVSVQTKRLAPEIDSVVEVALVVALQSLLGQLAKIYYIRYRLTSRSEEPDIRNEVAVVKGQSRCLRKTGNTRKEISLERRIRSVVNLTCIDNAVASLARATLSACSVGEGAERLVEAPERAFVLEGGFVVPAEGRGLLSEGMAVGWQQGQVGRGVLDRWTRRPESKKREPDSRDEFSKRGYLEPERGKRGSQKLFRHDGHSQCLGS
jgi:hypothetical protein